MFAKCIACKYLPVIILSKAIVNADAKQYWPVRLAN